MAKIDQQYYNEFQAFLEDNDIQHFEAYEVWNCEKDRTIKVHEGMANSPPPREMWTKCLLLLKILEEVRAELGIKIKVNSFWRHPDYNMTWKNAVPHSYHTQFIAADIIPLYLNGRPYPIMAFYDYMDKKLGESCGLQEYDNRVHVDTRVSKFRKQYYRR